MFRPTPLFLRTALLGISVITLGTAVLPAITFAQTESQSAHQLDSQVPVHLKYLLYQPKDYDTKGKWPLLLFLHGSGERGNDLDAVKVHGPPKLIAQGKEFPFIVVSPQCPNGQWWRAHELVALLDEVQSKYKVDKNQIWCTGLSMGGFGTWSLAFADPDRFAALAPICGGGEKYWAESIAHLPVWAFHGGKDKGVLVERSLEMVRALEESGGHPKLTIYPEAGHDSWSATYDNPEFYQWLLQQRRGTTKNDKPAVAPEPTSPESLRVRLGLVALYTFEEGKGSIVKDRSGSGRPLHLKIEKPSSVQWGDGTLLIRSATRIASTTPTEKLARAIKRSGHLTIEAWIRPKNDTQSGPARIVSLSSGTSHRNFTLGQDGKHYETRLRTTKTSANGIPAITTPRETLRLQRTHVVYTRNAAGQARFFVNGKAQPVQSIQGDLSGWSDSFELVLGDETSGGRPWLGEFSLVAIYSRSLSPEQVLQNYRVGPEVVHNGDLTMNRRNPKEDHFLFHVAPLLSKHCLECHDSAKREGGLDLSRKATVLAGGESGPAVVRGNSSESLVWEQVSSGEMPPDGTPLSETEMATLKKWIDHGAVWSGERIDPALYAHEGQSTQRWLQRLTVDEYIQTVRDTVGVDISEEASLWLPPDLRADGFSNTAYNLNVDLKHVDAYSKLANLIVERMDRLKFASRFSRQRKLSTDDTMRQFVSAMGKWMFRGPLEHREERNLSGIATTVASGGGSFEEAVRLILQAMLQSPRFLYRIEDQQDAGPVEPYELASRISYIIWGGPPDEKLFQSAIDGSINDPNEIAAHAQRMLKDPRAVQRSLRFIEEWLDLGRLSNMQPNAERFPAWSEELASDMRRETLAFFEEITWKQNRPLSDLLNAQVTFASPRLAKHYQLDAVETSRAGTHRNSNDLFSRYDLSKNPSRGGLLTQGSLLTIGGDDASMVTRGLFILKDVLRGTVGDPPPGLDTTPVPNRPGRSHRRVAQRRIDNVACGGCHEKIEPLAFGLEMYDGIGAWHETDQFGNALREDGSVLFPGASQAAEYDSCKAFMNLLAQNDRVKESLTWKVTQFALGRPLGPRDAATVQQIHKSAQEQVGTYANVVKAIVLSDLVRMYPPHK